jgi:hypothetical protein
MGGQAGAARSNPAMVVSVVVAAIAAAAFALAALAWIFGWMAPRAAVPTPASFASPGQQVAGTLPDMALAPGETLVASADAAAPGAKAAPKASVTAVRSAGRQWEVRLRFEDGSTRTLLYSERPAFRVGARVRLEDGRLVAD